MAAPSQPNLLAASQQRHGVIVGLTVGVAALGFALLVPVLFSDPNGIDPDSLRLALVAGLLAALAWAVPRLNPFRAPLLALAALAIPYTVWLATPWLLRQLALAHKFGSASVFALAQVLVLLATIALFTLCRRLVQADQKPKWRLQLTRAAVVATFTGTLGLLIIGMATPARWLGRVALQPAALARDAVWLVPGDILQGAAQELQFRGLLLGILEQVMPARLANLVQALLFGLAHLAVVYQGPEAPFVPLTILLGLLFGWVTQRTGSLWPAILIHGIADLLVDITIVPGLYGL